MSCAVRAVGLGRRFQRTAALEGVDLEVPEGAVYALVGPRGAGKTTCLRTLLNVLEPTAGSAQVLGVDSRRLGPREFRQIAYLAADQEMPESMTVGHYLQFLSGFYPTWDAGIAADLVRRFQLLLDRKFHQLSETPRRKAALVSSLAYRPRLIVLDEPFRGVDTLARGAMLSALTQHAEGATILISAEDPGDVEAFATHIGWLEGGRLRLSEELAALWARCREIVLTFDAAPELPPEWPEVWLAAERRPTEVRFIDTQFDERQTCDEASSRLPGFVDLAARPLPIADILAALAARWRSV